jgi:hypothetical protein
MPNICIHYFGDESSKSLLEAYGIESYNQKQTDVLENKVSKLFRAQQARVKVLQQVQDGPEL